MDPNKINIILPEQAVIDEDDTQSSQTKFLENFVNRDKLSYQTLLNLQINRIRMAFNKGDIDNIVRSTDFLEIMLKNDLKNNLDYQEKNKFLNKKYRGLYDSAGLMSKYKVKFTILLSLMKSFIPEDIVTDYIR